MGEWRPANEPPEANGPYLIVYEDVEDYGDNQRGERVRFVAAWSRGQWWAYEEMPSGFLWYPLADNLDWEVTHWAPLPGLPDYDKG